MSKEERKQANAEFKQAKAKLDEHAEKQKKAGNHQADDEYYRLNKAVNDASKRASWWNR
ncbi:multidrug resistance efflux pump [Lipingzhangella halophila]|uniref:Multidrug resistance efflux pump n=1 Tax=Lipingzhangella halophila TaxID=1783352 RepID=A0A7W7W257_9ACTN|nr:hypothetical protein [Lipingzhangella halophila]MBB4931396.1 multidrug resistance efflux pump [Lipingzhangella halophila]